MRDTSRPATLSIPPPRAKEAPVSESRKLGARVGEADLGNTGDACLPPTHLGPSNGADRDGSVPAQRDHGIALEVQQIRGVFGRNAIARIRGNVARVQGLERATANVRTRTRPLQRKRDAAEANVTARAGLCAGRSSCTRRQARLGGAGAAGTAQREPRQSLHLPRPCASCWRVFSRLAD